MLPSPQYLCSAAKKNLFPPEWENYLALIPWNSCKNGTKSINAHQLMTAGAELALANRFVPNPLIWTSHLKRWLIVIDMVA